MNLFRCVFVVFIGASGLSQETAKVVPGRYLVTYRNGQVPTDVDAQVALAGVHARVVANHAALGVTVVDTTEPRGTITAAQDAAMRAGLVAQPNV